MKTQKVCKFVQKQLVDKISRARFPRRGGLKNWMKFLLTWIEKGITQIGHLLSENGSFLSYFEVKKEIGL